tara:strand:- start:751 stop:1284 length:534 start_codon:yes stop_codon:yes gene_type:complete
MCERKRLKIEMVMNNDVRGGFGSITYNMNISWFILTLEERGYLLNVRGEELDEDDVFWADMEYIIQTVVDNNLYATNDMDELVCETLLDDADTYRKIEQYFTPREEKEWCDNAISAMEEADYGDIIVLEDVGGHDIEAEVIRGNMLAVKTLEDRALLREKVPEWFMDSHVGLLCEAN